MKPTFHHDDSSQGGIELDRLFGFNLDEDSWLSRVRTAESPRHSGRIGPYEVLAVIGRGGQGIVYKVKQPRTGREIALKRLSAGAFATPAMRARFDREVEVAAALDHPNIVTVFGSETIDDQLVLAMQWIDGTPIDRWAAPLDGRKRDVREILAAFQSVCSALQHAHQRGIIHRDLKPSNILVDRNGCPQVLDFGLAKFCSADGPTPELTRSGAFMGTPAYAAPEQFRGTSADVDVRTDVYGLGAILHQLLTGRVPLTDVGGRTQFARLQRGRGTAAGGSSAGMDAELQAIVARALSPEKDQRYASVDALAVDVRQYLARGPVSAYSTRKAYRFWKLIRRNAWTSGLAASASVLIVSLAISTVVMGVRLAREAREAKSAAAHEREHRLRADELAVAAKSFGEEAARLAAKNEAASAFLNGLLTASTNPMNATNTAPSNPVIELAIRQLDGGAMVDHPELEYAMRFQFGRQYYKSDRADLALNQYLAAVSAARRAFGNRSEEAAKALGDLGVTQRKLHRYGESEASIVEAISIWDQLRNNEAPASWVAELGATFRLAGKHLEAEQAYARAAALWTRTQGPERPLTHVFWWQLLREQVELKHWPDAERSAENVLAADEARGRPQDADTGWVLTILGQARLEQSDFAGGVDALQKALVVARQTGADAASISRITGLLGYSVQRLGRHAEAVPLLHESLGMTSPKTSNAPSTRIRQLRLGVSLLATGDETEARRWLRAALGEQETDPRGAAQGEDRIAAMFKTLRASEFRIDDNPIAATLIGDLASAIASDPDGILGIGSAAGDE